MTIPRVAEAAIAATVVAIAATLVAWRIDADIVLLPVLAFAAVFLVTLWRSRTSTIHHRSSRPAARRRVTTRTKPEVSR